ncbi:MAG: alanine racemase [Actinomycetota bacterium]|nr:alanine racemase [Actinomycetota bacterium]
MGLTREEIAKRGHPIWAEIDLGALRHNVGVLRKLAPDSEFMGVVKGYAYGHGNPRCADTMLAAGATRLGVARVSEALHLREAGITAPIHVFTEPPDGAVTTLIENDLTATVYTPRFAQLLSDEAQATGRVAKVHVKLDTGMHRVGLLTEDVADAVRLFKTLGGIDVEGAWSHFAVGGIPDHPFTRKQLDLFHELVERIERAGLSLRFKHIANSGATLLLPETHLDIVRPGAASYGLWPSRELIGSADLRPVMTLKARVNMVKKVPAGEALSYGLRYELAAAGNVATVSAGFADGYDRRLSGEGKVGIAGKGYRVSGTVCMDQFMVDVGDDDVQVGTTVVLIGSDGGFSVSAEELAAQIGTINYEVTSRIPSRVPRVYIDE